MIRYEIQDIKKLCIVLSELLAKEQFSSLILESNTLQR